MGCITADDYCRKGESSMRPANVDRTRGPASRYLCFGRFRSSGKDRCHLQTPSSFWCFAGTDSYTTAGSPVTERATLVSIVGKSGPVRWPPERTEKTISGITQGQFGIGAAPEARPAGEPLIERVAVVSDDTPAARERDVPGRGPVPQRSQRDAEVRRCLCGPEPGRQRRIGFADWPMDSHDHYLCTSSLSSVTSAGVVARDPQ